MAYYCFKPSVLFFGAKATLTFTAGILILLVLSAGFIFLLLKCALYPRYRLKVSLLFVLFFFVGLALGLLIQGKAEKLGRVQTGFSKDGIIALKGTLIDDPRTSSGGRGMASLNLMESFGKKACRASAAGKVLIYFPEEAIPRVKDFGRGSVVYIEGKFGSGKGGGGPVFSAKSVYVVNAPSPVERLRTKCRMSLVKVFDSGADFGTKSGGWGGLSLALLLGIKDELNGELARQYRDAGCSYILALSGMHLAIVSSIIAFLLRRPLGLKPAAILGAVFIVIYVYLAGAQPSLVRAAIMYLAGTAAVLFSLQKEPLKLLLLAFILQLVLDSASGRSVSFILSYLALAGILLFSGTINSALKGWLPPFIAGPLSVSLAAYLATAQISACVFGAISFIGIISGLIMVPLTTFFMIISIIYLGLHFVLPILKVPLELLLSACYRLLQFAAKTASLVPPLHIKNVLPFILISFFLSIMLLFLCRRLIKRRFRRLAF